MKVQFILLAIFKDRKLQLNNYFITSLFQEKGRLRVCNQATGFPCRAGPGLPAGTRLARE